MATNPAVICTSYGVVTQPRKEGNERVNRECVVVTFEEKDPDPDAIKTEARAVYFDPPFPTYEVGQEYLLPLPKRTLAASSPQPVAPPLVSTPPPAPTPSP